MGEFRYNVPLGPMNSFGIDATAKYMLEFENSDELVAYFNRSDKPSDRWTVISGGNNILLTRDYEGVVLHPTGRRMEVLGEGKDMVRVRVEAGVEWDDFVAWCVAHGWSGVENLSLIPGYVGAAPVQNIGAYGVEVKEVVESVEALMIDTLESQRFSNAECKFGYRESVFKNRLRGQAIITAVTFALRTYSEPRLGYGDLKAETQKLGEPTLENIRRAVIAIRRRKLPDPKEMGNAGSFFKNPVVDQTVADALQMEYENMPIYPVGKGRVKLAAGWLIDQAGWRGAVRGRVGVHERQALVLVNRGGATGDEVLDLAREIQHDVEQKFGVKIEPEVNIL